MEQVVLDTLNLMPFGALTTVCEDGTPYALPMHFAADDRNLYWFSMPDSVHSQNIARNPAISFAVWMPDRIPNLRGVSINTVARKIDNEYEMGRGRTVFTMKFPEIPDAFADYSMYTAPIGEVNYDKSGNTWYLNARDRQF